MFGMKKNHYWDIGTLPVDILNEFRLNIQMFLGAGSDYGGGFLGSNKL
jgi:hypothetical protein